MLLTSTKHGFDKETLKNDKKGGKEKRRCFLFLSRVFSFGISENAAITFCAFW